MVVGGRNNIASGITSFIGGGFLNKAIAECSTIGGGYCNTVCQFTANGYSVLPNTIGGGGCNTIYSNTNLYNPVGGNTIGGGWRNKVFSYYGCSVIAGGACNVICCELNTIGGGLFNRTTSANGFIGGGRYNFICTLDSVIGGGFCNIIRGTCSSILGGCYNTIPSGLTKSNIIGSRITANRSCTTFVNDLSVCSFTGSSGCNVGITTNGLLIPVSPGGGLTPIKLTGQTLVEGFWTIVGDYYTYSFFSEYITVNCDVSVTPQNASYLTAYNAQVLPYVGVASGVATLYSQFPPDENMVVDIVITSTNAGVTTFFLESCSGYQYTGYSISSVFETGITVYSDFTLTTPLIITNGSPVYTNTGQSLNRGYLINNQGVVGILIICD